MKKYWVYILLCSDHTYYTGITNDIDRRFSEHQSGHNPDSYVSSRRPVQLVYSHVFTDVLHAIAWEKQIKPWSRKKKEALIRGEFEALPELAKCINETSHENAAARMSSSRLRSN